VDENAASADLKKGSLHVHIPIKEITDTAAVVGKHQKPKFSETSKQIDESADVQPSDSTEEPSTSGTKKPQRLLVCTAASMRISCHQSGRKRISQEERARRQKKKAPVDVYHLLS